MGFLVSGCTVTYDVVGKFDDANEVFRGDVVSNLSAGTSVISATGQITGLKCDGGSYVTYVPPMGLGCSGQRGKADLTCDDGRRIDADWQATSCTTGFGEGKDQYGNSFTFAFGLDKKEAEKYVIQTLPQVKDKPQLSSRRINQGMQPNTEGNTQENTPTTIFPETPVFVQFDAPKMQPDDIAIIIGNANYETNGKDIPNVIPAYADAEGIKRYATDALGIRQDNILYIRDAKFVDLVSVFGNEANYEGQLFNWITPGKSRVFVYYSGHGAPSLDGNSAYLVPSNANASQINLHGFKLSTLYKNLSKLPAKSVTVVLEACFSGLSTAGTVISNASPVYLKAKDTGIPSNITVVAAGAANQIASWEEDKSHGLFTKYFLKGMSGEADKDENQKVSWDELKDYFAETVTRQAIRKYARQQTPQIVVGSGG
jgi:hypothetical protein